MAASATKGRESLRELETQLAQSEARYGVVSKQGGRPYNEDYCSIRDYSARRRPKYLCFIAIADGMGGHQAGDVASSVAVQMLEQYTNPAAFTGADDFEERAEGILWNAFSAANSHVHDLGLADPGHEGMGTTLTCALVGFDNAYFAHVGDTRAYSISASGITQITEDHSVVGKMVTEGILTESQARTHAKRNILTRAVGPELNVEIDLLKVQLDAGDIIFMCCDGLSSTVTAGDIFHIVGSEPNLQSACEQLVDLAIARGSDDNVSAVAWRKPHTPGGTGAKRAPKGDARAARNTLPVWVVTLLTLLSVCLGFAVGWGLGALFLSNKTPTKTTSPAARSAPSTTALRTSTPEQMSSGPAEGNGFAEGATVAVSLTSGTCGLRETADTNQPPKAQLKNGCKLKILSAIPKKDSSGRQWYQVQVTDTTTADVGKEGYVAAQFLKAP